VSELAKATPYLFWRISGRLVSHNELDLRLGYLTEDPEGSAEDPRSALVAKLYAAGGELLVSHRVPLQRFSGGTSSSVLGSIPFPAGTRLIRLEYADTILKEVVVPARGPELELTWYPAARVAGKATVTWRGDHPLGQPLNYFVKYSHTDGQSWIPLGLRTSAEQKEVDFEKVPGGPRCRVAVMATDGVNTRVAQTDPFHVAIKPCRAMILEPAEGLTAPRGAPIVLRGQGFWLEENRPELVELTWSSSMDGYLGDGARVVARLSLGVHRISLEAGVGERIGTSEVRVTITPKAGR
jgi:hypothetical protein